MKEYSCLLQSELHPNLVRLSDTQISLTIAVAKDRLQASLPGPSRGEKATTTFPTKFFAHCDILGLRVRALSEYSANSEMYNSVYRNQIIAGIGPCQRHSSPIIPQKNISSLTEV
ncbi:hypothetical protein C0J52_11081 [Blattella germanica]|nr:hypothetical protein C0J52_11081 [Blattella germanica]